MKHSVGFKELSSLSFAQTDHQLRRIMVVSASRRSPNRRRLLARYHSRRRAEMGSRIPPLRQTRYNNVVTSFKEVRITNAQCLPYWRIS